MADTRKVVRIFIASPGDLGEERVSAKAVADEFNSIWAEEFGYQVELVGWEDAVSMYGRPQSLINKDLERCELFIGMLWKRWGTPPDKSGPYTSGFEEEFSISVDRRKADGKPEISLFFKEIDRELLLDPGPDLKKVLIFRDKIIADKEILFEKFQNPEDFQTKFRRCISNYVKKLRGAEIGKLEEKSKTNLQGSSTAEQSSESADTFLPEEAKSFVGQVLVNERGALSNAQVSRLRLIGQVIGVAGNDDHTIGVHDANILFLHRSSLNLSDLEVSGLIDCGLEHFRNENCPVWHWIAVHNVLGRAIFPIYAVYGPVESRRGAWEAMTLIGEPFTGAAIDRDRSIAVVFGDKSEARLKVAALAYLEECGFKSDLPIIRTELARADVNTRSAAINAILRISLRDSVEDALSALFDLQPETIPANLLTAIFDRTEGLASDVLISGLTCRNSEVRLATINALKRSKALTREAAESLLSDNDAKIRLEAILALVEDGRKFSEQEARRILVKPMQGGLFGASGGYDVQGGNALDQFRAKQMGLMSDEELSALVQSASIYDNVPYLTRAEKYFAKYGDELREAVRDGFKTYFEKTLERMASSGWTDDSIQKAKPLEDFMRKNLTREGLDIISKRLLVSDLGLIRQLLKQSWVSYSRFDVAYLKKYGEWSDILLIVSSLDRVSYGSATGLLFFGSSHYETAANAIHEIGKSRLAQLLELSAPFQLTYRVVFVSSDREFRELPDELILRLFNSEHETIRKAASLKAVKSLPKRRLGNLLNNYIGGEQFRYYNVIHWLDFGVSLPRSRANRGVSKATALMR